MDVRHPRLWIGLMALTCTALGLLLGLNLQPPAVSGSPDMGSGVGGGPDGMGDIWNTPVADVEADDSDRMRAWHDRARSRAEQDVAELTELLGLSDEQAADFMDAWQVHYETTLYNMRLGMKAMKSAKNTYDTSLQQILTDDQYMLLEQWRDERRQRMREKWNQRRGPRHRDGDDESESGDAPAGESDDETMNDGAGDESSHHDTPGDGGGAATNAGADRPEWRLQ